MSDYSAMVPRKNPRECQHGLSWVPGMAQGDYTRLCEECGLEVDSQHVVTGKGDTDVDAATLALIQRVQALEGLVHHLSLRLEPRGCDEGQLELCRAAITTVTGWTFSRPEDY